MMKLLIRPFGTSDRLSLRDAIDDVCRECEWMATTRFQPTPAWEYALAHPNCESYRLFVAQAADRVIGWCRLFPVNSGSNSVQAELGIGLLKEYRYQGWGAALLDETLKRVDRTGWIQVTLSVHPDNIVACRLFWNYGFDTVGPAPNDAISMMLRCVSERTPDQHARLGGAGGE